LCLYLIGKINEIVSETEKSSKHHDMNKISVIVCICTAQLAL